MTYALNNHVFLSRSWMLLILKLSYTAPNAILLCQHFLKQLYCSNSNDADSFNIVFMKLVLVLDWVVCTYTSWLSGRYKLYYCFAFSKPSAKAPLDLWRLAFKLSKISCNSRFRDLRLYLCSSFSSLHHYFLEQNIQRILFVIQVVCFFSRPTFFFTSRHFFNSEDCHCIWS